MSSELPELPAKTWFKLIETVTSFDKVDLSNLAEQVIHHTSTKKMETSDLVSCLFEVHPNALTPLTTSLGKLLQTTDFKEEFTRYFLSFFDEIVRLDTVEYSYLTEAVLAHVRDHKYTAARPDEIFDLIWLITESPFQGYSRLSELLIELTRTLIDLKKERRAGPLIQCTKGLQVYPGSAEHIRETIKVLNRQNFPPKNLTIKDLLDSILSEARDIIDLADPAAFTDDHISELCDVLITREYIEFVPLVPLLQKAIATLDPRKFTSEQFIEFILNLEHHDIFPVPVFETARKLICHLTPSQVMKMEWLLTAIPKSAIRPIAMTALKTIRSMIDDESLQGEDWYSLFNLLSLFYTNVFLPLLRLVNTERDLRDSDMQFITPGEEYLDNDLF